MTALTPSLAERNKRRGNLLAWAEQEARIAIGRFHTDSMQRHDRLSVHPDRAMRSELRKIRRDVNALGHRYLLAKVKLDALDLSKAADWTAYQAFSASNLFNLTKGINDTDLPGWSGLPSVGLTPAQLAEWPVETTVHEVHEAFEGEVRDLVGSDLHFLGTTLITLPQDKVEQLGELRHRRDAMLALTTYPDDPFEADHWGHDAGITSLVLTPTTGSGVTITPAFATGTLAYTMPYRGDQILRADVALRDSRAKWSLVKEKHRAIIRVTTAMKEVVDTIVSGNAEAKLSSLSFGPAPGTDYPYSPAFDAETTAYVTTAPLAGILNVVASASTPGATVAWTKDATGVDVTVTAADGATTRTYRITSSHSG